MQTVISKRMASKKSIIAMGLSLKDFLFLMAWGAITALIIFNTLWAIYLKIIIIVVLGGIASLLVFPKGEWTKPWKMAIYRWRWIWITKKYVYKKRK